MPAGAFRKKKTSFAQVSNVALRDETLSLKAKGLLSLMLSLPDDWNYSISGLVTLSKDGKDSVMSALAELEKFGYLERQRIVNDKGQFAGVEYNIFEQPQPEKPTAAKQNEEMQKAAKANTENRQQLNTNSTNYLLDKVFELLNTNDAELIALYREYIKMRDNINAPITESGLEALVERCNRLSKGNVKVQKILLENAIINNWKNIYMPRETELQELNKEVVQDFKNLLGLE